MNKYALIIFLLIVIIVLILTSNNYSTLNLEKNVNKFRLKTNLNDITQVFQENNTLLNNEHNLEIDIVDNMKSDYNQKRLMNSERYQPLLPSLEASYDLY